MNMGQQVHTILVVEDDAHTRELLNFNLSDAGYHVFEAADAAAALKVLNDEPVDLIISDVMLPGSNGFDFRQKLVNDPALREIAFMFLTAKSLAEDQIRGIESGAEEYITKPFDIEVLLARVSAVIARREHFARVASIDPLTGLLNRQALERAIGRELSRLRRYPAVASLIFLDIDNFKSLNDQYGHATGDEVLRHLSEVLRQHSRAVDIVGRFGGEEFVLFFPQTSEDEGCFVLERMQDHFRSAGALDVDQPLTFSAGLAEAPRDGDVFEDLCAKADAAMYYSKRHGKAQIIPWRPALEEEESAPH